MKLKKSKLTLFSIIFVIILCINSLVYAENCCGRNYLHDEKDEENYWKNMVDHLEYLEGRGTHLNYKIYDRLQLAARTNMKEFYNFNAQTLITNHAGKLIAPHYHDRYYDYNSKCCICISPGDHASATRQEITCIIDVVGDGTVIVYSKGKDPKTTKYSKNKNAVQKAYELAYYAYMSRKNDEGAFSYTGTPYKSLLRFYGFGKYETYFKQLGVPNEYYPKHQSSSWDPAPSVREKQGAEATEIVKKMLKGQTDEMVRARFIFLCGYAAGSNTGASGQNDCIYGGKLIEKPSETLEISKIDASSNKALKGAKFSIYKTNPNTDTNATAIASGKTNAKGIIKYSTKINDSEKIKENNEYWIKETAAPTGYELPAETVQYVKIKKGKNTVTFKDAKKGNMSISVQKYDKYDGEPIEGAKFYIWRWQLNKLYGAYELDANNNIIAANWPNSTLAIPPAGIPQSFKYGDQTLYYLRNSAIASHDAFIYTTDYYSVVNSRANWWYYTLDEENKEVWHNKEYVNILEHGNSPKYEPYVSVHTYRFKVQKNTDGTWKTDANGSYVLEKNHQKEYNDEKEVVLLVNRGERYWEPHYSQGYYKASGDGSPTFVSMDYGGQTTDNEVSTDADGSLYITNTAISKDCLYYAREVQAPEGYELYNNGQDFVIGIPTEQNPNAQQTIDEKPKEGTGTLEKVNEANPDIKLNNIGFTFHHERYGWVVKNGDGSITYSENPDLATTFYTGINSRIPNNNDGTIYIEHLAYGEYTYYEDMDTLPAGYQVSSEGQGTGTFTINGANPNASIQVVNSLKYIKISGTVWEDKYGLKTDSFDNLDRVINTEGEHGLNNVKVSFIVKDENGNIDEERTRRGEAKLERDENGNIIERKGRNCDE